MKSGMKYVIMIVVVFAIAAFTERAGEKKYKMELTQQQWQNTLDVLAFATQAIKNSDLPAKQALPLTDSLAKFSAEIIAQIRPQIVDTTAKKDTTIKH